MPQSSQRKMLKQVQHDIRHSRFTPKQARRRLFTIPDSRFPKFLHSPINRKPTIHADHGARNELRRITKQPYQCAF
jgi:hypothetical protein